MATEFGPNQTRCGSQERRSQRRFRVPLRVPRPGRGGYLALGTVVLVLASAGAGSAGIAPVERSAQEEQDVGVVFSLTLRPKTATNTVGTTHTVTAHLTENGHPVFDEQIDFICRLEAALISQMAVLQARLNQDLTREDTHGE